MNLWVKSTKRFENTKLYWTGCTSVSTFASLACIPIGITNSAIGLKIYAITAAIKKYKSIIKKKKN